MGVSYYRLRETVVFFSEDYRHWREFPAGTIVERKTYNAVINYYPLCAPEWSRSSLSTSLEPLSPLELLAYQAEESA